MNSCCHHHSLLVSHLLLAGPSRRDGNNIDGVPCKTLAQRPHFAVRCYCWIGGYLLQVVLQPWIRVGVAVGQVARVWVIGEPESPGERVQAVAVIIVLIWILPRHTIKVRWDWYIRSVQIRAVKPALLVENTYFVEFYKFYINMWQF